MTKITMAEPAKKEERKPTVSYDIFGRVLYNAVAFLNGYDEQTLSLCMRAFEVSLMLSPSSLSIMATVEMMALLGCSPIWGYLADKFAVNYVLGTAMLINGMVCILLGTSSHYGLIVFIRFLHGFSLSCTSPVSQKIITSSIDSDSMTAHFGIFHSMMCLGRLSSAMVTTSLSMTILLGHYGWRVCYCFFGYIWIAIAALVVIYMRPKPKTESSGSTGTTQHNSSDFPLTKLKAVFKTTTSKILLFEIFLSDAPFCAFVYMIMFLQYVGLSDFMAGVCCAASLVGGVIGGICGGFIITECHKKWGNYGRLGAGITMVVVRIVFTLLFFLGPMPTNGKPSWYHYVEVALLGASLLTVSAVDRPIMADVVKKEHQAFASGINRCLAGIPSSAVYVPLCGFLAERVFGYLPSADSMEKLEAHVKSTNANALRKSIMYVIAISTVLNIGCYIAMCFTYPKDKDTNKSSTT